jgi:hypothetical protein
MALMPEEIFRIILIWIYEEHFNYWLGALPYYDNVRKEGIVLAG